MAQGLTVAASPGNAAFGFVGRWRDFAQSIDQRVKMAGWLELFEARGGKVIYHGVMTSDLVGLASLYELTIIAAGKGELVELFHRDHSRSPYDRPQRTLAAIYVQAIVQHGERPFDAEWMQRTFDAYWDYAGHVTAYTNMMLGPLPDHVQRILVTAAGNQVVGDRFAHGYADPSDFEDWLMDPDRADAYLSSVAPGPAGTAAH